MLRYNPRLGPIAQLGERRVRNAEVVSSILIRSTKFQKANLRRLAFFCAQHGVPLVGVSPVVS